MRRTTLRLCGAALIGTTGLALTGCGRGGQVILEDDSGTVIIDVDRDQRGREYPPEGHTPGGRYESKLPKIPPGHMPPPGMCRVWYPDRPPGQQPPPVPCDHARHDIPPGAWLVRGD